MSGGGKGTVVARIRERHPDLWLSVSATTRAPRPGELDGEHYHFVDDAAFDTLEATGGLVEWVPVYGHRSGTPRAPIDAALAAGRDVLLELEVNGAEFVHENWPDAVVVFLVTPDAEVQRRRLTERGTTGADLETRLAEAAAETERARRFACVVVNDDLDEAVDAVDAILFAPPPPRP